MAAFSTIDATRWWRVSGRAAPITHHSIALRARGKGVPVGARGGVGVERGGEFGGLEEVLDRVVDRPVPVGPGHLDGPPAGVGHEPGGLHRRHPLTVEASPGALGLARRHQLECPVVVEHVHRRVDPAEAQRLLHGVGVRARRSTGHGPPGAHPHATFGHGSPPARRATGAGLGVVDRQVELPPRRVLRRRRNGSGHRPRSYERPSPVPGSPELWTARLADVTPPSSCPWLRHPSPAQCSWASWRWRCCRYRHRHSAELLSPLAVAVLSLPYLAWAELLSPLAAGGVVSAAVLDPGHGARRRRRWRWRCFRRRNRRGPCRRLRRCCCRRWRWRCCTPSSAKALLLSPLAVAVLSVPIQAMAVLSSPLAVAVLPKPASATGHAVVAAGGGGVPTPRRRLKAMLLSALARARLC